MSENEINKDMTFGELLQTHPEASPVLLEYGLHCVGCHISTFETIEQGARAHGLTDVHIESMMERLNNLA